jgi:glycerol-3-phosphate dehydrogenase (NAD(P)+)
MEITVFGAGAWGTAIATVLSNNNNDVLLWCYEQDVVDEINATRINRVYLPGVVLNERIMATGSLKEACEFSNTIFEVVPVAFLRGVLKKTKSFVNDKICWVLASKGIERDSLLFPTGIVDDIFGPESKKVVFSGPNFAKDVANKFPTATTIASADTKLADKVAKLLANEYFKPYLSQDVIGAQVGGALKNVVALAIGVITGAGYPDNTRSFILTKSLAEMKMIACDLGGKEETVYGFSGVGDLVLTALGSQSRNVKTGTMIGQGIPLSKIEEKLHVLPEGINTVQSLQQLIKKRGLKVPLFESIYQVLFGEMSPEKFVSDLMPLSVEWE